MDISYITYCISLDINRESKIILSKWKEEIVVVITDNVTVFWGIFFQNVIRYSFRSVYESSWSYFQSETNCKWQNEVWYPNSLQKQISNFLSCVNRKPALVPITKRVLDSVERRQGPRKRHLPRLRYARAVPSAYLQTPKSSKDVTIILNRLRKAVWKHCHGWAVSKSKAKRVWQKRENSKKQPTIILMMSALRPSLVDRELLWYFSVHCIEKMNGVFASLWRSWKTYFDFSIT